jgi:hypothetical protein
MWDSSKPQWPWHVSIVACVSYVFYLLSLWLFIGVVTSILMQNMQDTLLKKCIWDCWKWHQPTDVMVGGGRGACAGDTHMLQWLEKEVPMGRRHVYSTKRSLGKFEEIESNMLWKKLLKTRGVGEKCAPYGMYLYLKTLVGKNKEIDI